MIGIYFIVFNLYKYNSLFNYDVEFSGGVAFKIDIGKDFKNNDIENIVKEVTKQSTPQIQRILNSNQVIIKLKHLDPDKSSELMDKLSAKYGFDKNKSVIISDISATISNEMRRTAVISVSLACVAILFYISLRFHNLKMGLCSIVALLHDTIATTLVYIVLRIPLNYSFIAVILTILGYSINATIVIFDRIRENKNKIKDKIKLIDTSVSQTFRRSIFTSVTTLLSIICLYIIGVQSIKDFTLPIIIGIIFGTYSSVCLAPLLWYFLKCLN
jgi:preprotein translocase SecF subunit